MKKIVFGVLAVALMTGNAIAQEKGDWQFKAGPYVVAPKSDNNDVVNVDDGTSLGFTITYFFSETWALEVLASTPFSHDINVNGGPQVGETKHLPPTFTLQYHLPTAGQFKPYVGAGLNYTLFFDEELSGPLAGNDLSLDGSFGLAAQIGADYEINEKWSIGANLRWIDIDTDAEITDSAGVSTSLGSVEIDPLVYGITIGYSF